MVRFLAFMPFDMIGLKESNSRWFRYATTPSGMSTTNARDMHVACLGFVDSDVVCRIKD